MVEWKLPLKWMIWGYPYFRNPPFVYYISGRVQRQAGVEHITCRHEATFRKMDPSGKPFKTQVKACKCHLYDSVAVHAYIHTYIHTCIHTCIYSTVAFAYSLSILQVSLTTHVPKPSKIQFSCKKGNSTGLR